VRFDELVKSQRISEVGIFAFVGENMDERVVAILKIHSRQLETDLDIPLDITAQELLVGLNNAFGLEIDTANARNCHVHTENPIALLRGSKTLGEYGIRNGTVINIL
jgi:uncharacterized ubiquitin-like protein YukD